MGENKRKAASWEECDFKQRERIKKYVVPIYEWLTAHKHEYRNGVTSSMLFAHVVPRNTSSGYFDSVKDDTAEYRSFINLINGLKHNGFVRYQQEVPNKPKVWSVNEAILPPGTVQYTGVRQVIPLDKEEKKPEPPTIIEPNKETCEAFFESELKSIKVQDCVLGNGSFNFTADVHLHDITLWDIYKLGLALEQTLGTKFGKEVVVPGCIKESLSVAGEECEDDKDSGQQAADSEPSEESDANILIEEEAAF